MKPQWLSLVLVGCLGVCSWIVYMGATEQIELNTKRSQINEVLIQDLRKDVIRIHSWLRDLQSVQNDLRRECDNIKLANQNLLDDLTSRLSMLEHAPGCNCPDSTPFIQQLETQVDKLQSRIDGLNKWAQELVEFINRKPVPVKPSCPTGHCPQAQVLLPEQTKFLQSELF